MTFLTRTTLALAVTAILVGSGSASEAAPIFHFETSDFWLNLHHFLYVLGRAEARTPDSNREAVRGAPDDAARGMALLSDEERVRWVDAVHAYAIGPSRKDLIFDDSLATVTAAIAGARDAATLPKDLDPAIAAVLERSAPIYRKAWWPAHRAANEQWRSTIQALVDRHGAQVLAFITRAYGFPWPAAGYPVHLCAYANAFGAYSTTIARLLVVSTLDPGTAGTLGLETLFHEAMHQWDDPIFAQLGEQARKIDKPVPRDLSHAMIFFTAGEAVRSVVPDHVPYADAAGVWARGMGPLRAALVDTWKPYLDGRSTRDEALAALVAKTAVARR